MFAATNADDLVIVAIFFAEPGCRKSQVIFGQLAGIAALIAMSYAAAVLALAVPHSWLPFLGLFPLAMGLHWLFKSPAGDDDEEVKASGSRWWMVAGITLANGADNLGVYIPAFALQSPREQAITAATFLVLTVVWCALAGAAVNHPRWGKSLQRISRRLAPWVLIGIGLWILAQHPALRF